MAYFPKVFWKEDSVATTPSAPPAPPVAAAGTPKPPPSELIVMGRIDRMLARLPASQQKAVLAWLFAKYGPANCNAVPMG